MLSASDTASQRQSLFVSETVFSLCYVMLCYGMLCYVCLYQSVTTYRNYVYFLTYKHVFQILKAGVTDVLYTLSQECELLAIFRKEVYDNHFNDFL